VLHLNRPWDLLKLVSNEILWCVEILLKGFRRFCYGLKSLGDADTGLLDCVEEWWELHWAQCMVAGKLEYGFHIVGLLTSCVEEENQRDSSSSQPSLGSIPLFPDVLRHSFGRSEDITRFSPLNVFHGLIA
jgi:hypothetical protein